MSKVVCAYCGAEFDEENGYVDHNGDPVCEECRFDVMYECDDCGELYHMDDVTMVDDRVVCDYCLESGDYRTCDHCGEIHAVEMMVEDDFGNCVCRDCYDYYYTTCEDCGRIVSIDEIYEGDDECYYCENCIDDHRNEFIKEYHGFSNWQAYKTNNKDNSLMKGFELEVNCGDDLATELHDLMGDFMVYERDGSIDGFECITNPFSREWQYENQDLLKEFCDKLYQDYDNLDGCGLHIHVSREQIETDTLTFDDVIDNIYLIMETFQDELVKFSRRNPVDLSRWAEFLTAKDEAVTIKKIKDKKGKFDRYRALNLTKDKTIEFRLFKSTVSFNELMASLELVDNIVDLAKRGDLDGLTWNDVVSFGGSFIAQYVNDLNITSDKVLKIV